jgi:hypothetical protein
MSAQPYVTREDNDANNARIRHFLLLSFFCLFGPQLEDPRIFVLVFFFVFLFCNYQLLPGDNEQYLPTHGNPLLPVIPAPSVQS